MQTHIMNGDSKRTDIEERNVYALNRKESNVKLNIKPGFVAKMNKAVCDLTLKKKEVLQAMSSLEIVRRPTQQNESNHIEENIAAKNTELNNLMENKTFVGATERLMNHSHIIDDLNFGSIIYLKINQLLNEENFIATAFVENWSYKKKYEELLKSSVFDCNYSAKPGDTVLALDTFVGGEELTRATVHAKADDGLYIVSMPDKGFVRRNIKKVVKVDGEIDSLPYQAVKVTFLSDLNMKLATGEFVKFKLDSVKDNRWMGRIIKINRANDGRMMEGTQIATGKMEAWEPDYIDVYIYNFIKCKIESLSAVVLNNGGAQTATETLVETAKGGEFVPDEIDEETIQRNNTEI